MWPGDNAGGGGGGFVGSQGNQFDSPAGGGEKGKGGRRNLNVVPATIKQLLECHEENFRVVDVEANNVTVVGLVTAVDQTTTKISVHIDDQTGIIDCINYIGSGGANAAEIPFVPMEGTYGRVVGGLRTSKSGTKYLLIFRFFPVTDMNELTAHMLEVIHLPMKLKKLKETEGMKSGVGMSSSGLNNTLGNSMVVGNFGGPGVLGMAGGSGGGGGGGAQAPKTSFNPIQKSILNIIQSNASDTGIHKDDIMRNLKGSMNPKDLSKLLEELSAEGHIYSTVDDDHFRSTD